MRIYLKKNRAKFHLDPIWTTDGALGFLKSVICDKMSSEMGLGTWC